VPEGLSGVEVDPARRCASARDGAILEYFPTGSEPAACE